MLQALRVIVYFYAFLLGTDGYGLRVNISEMAKVDEPPSSFTQRGLDRSGGLLYGDGQKTGVLGSKHYYPSSYVSYPWVWNGP